MNANGKSYRSGKAAQPKQARLPADSPCQTHAVNMADTLGSVDHVFGATSQAVQESIEETFGKTVHDFLFEADNKVSQRAPLNAADKQPIGMHKINSEKLTS